MALTLDQIRRKGKQTFGNIDSNREKPTRRTIRPWEEIPLENLESGNNKDSLAGILAVEPLSQNAPQDNIIRLVEDAEGQATAINQAVLNVVSNQAEESSPALIGNLNQTRPQKEHDVAENARNEVDPKNFPSSTFQQQSTPPDHRSSVVRAEVGVKNVNAIVPKKKTKDASNSNTEVRTLIFKETQTLKSESAPASIDEERYGFGQLSGVQRKITQYIFNSCLERGTLETRPLTRGHLAEAVGVLEGSVSESLRRLMSKKILAQTRHKTGRGGWAKYLLSQEVYNEMAQGNRTALTSDLEPKKTTVEFVPSNVVTNEVCSSEWASIDFSEIAAMGFSQYHLKQLENHKKLSAGEVQKSIDFFAFDLKSNDKRKDIKGDPINFFMGILRRGSPYLPPANFISKEDLIRKKYLEFFENKEKTRIEERNRIKELAFRDWLQTDVSHVLASAPEYVKGKDSPSQRGYLENYFDTNVWPSIASKLN